MVSWAYAGDILDGVVSAVRQQRLPDDLFRHRVLGFGTGDFVVKPASGDTFEIHNVWRANKKQRQLEDMIATRAVKGM